jgi:uncharacterized protein YkwD
MAPFLRIAAAVLVVVSLGAFLVHSPPGWLRNQVDRARAAQDPWAAYLAPPSACKSEVDTASEERTMICLLDWARAQRGLKPLRVVYPLNRSSILKALAIARCGDFSHTPCGKSFADTFDAVGYRGPVATSYGENIAWGAGAAGSARVVVSGWLNSPHHRENLFSPDWAEQGVAVLPLARFLGSKNVEIWVSQFGVRA